MTALKVIKPQTSWRTFSKCELLLSFTGKSCDWLWKCRQTWEVIFLCLTCEVLTNEPPTMPLAVFLSTFVNSLPFVVCLWDFTCPWCVMVTLTRAVFSLSLSALYTKAAVSTGALCSGHGLVFALLLLHRSEWSAAHVRRPRLTCNRSMLLTCVQSWDKSRCPALRPVPLPVSLHCNCTGVSYGIVIHWSWAYSPNAYSMHWKFETVLFCVVQVRFHYW